MPSAQCAARCTLHRADKTHILLHTINACHCSRPFAATSKTRTPGKWQFNFRFPGKLYFPLPEKPYCKPILYSTGGASKKRSVARCIFAASFSIHLTRIGLLIPLLTTTALKPTAGRERRSV
jgi:hypothetical protein